MNNVIKFLFNQTKTCCLYSIVEELGIIIIEEPLGYIKGYYNKVDEQKFIHVNSDLSEWYQKFAVAQQLYYALQDMEYQFTTITYVDHKSDAFQFALALLYYDGEKPKHDYQLIMA